MCALVLIGEREVGTEGKLLLLATEDGELIGVGLQSRKMVSMTSSYMLGEVGPYLDTYFFFCKFWITHIQEGRSRSSLLPGGKILFVIELQLGYSGDRVLLTTHKYKQNVPRSLLANVSFTHHVTFHTFILMLRPQ